MTQIIRKSRSTRSVFVLLIAVAGIGLAPRTATADTLDDVINVMVKYGVIDPAIADAREMLRCLVAHNGDAGACFNIPTEAEKQAGASAAKFMPDDPKVRSVVDLVLAATQEQWLTVIEIAGVQIMLPLLCDFSTAATGPVGKWVCKGPFKTVVVEGFAEPVAKEVFSVLASDDSSIEKLFQLVTLVGNVDLACDLIPLDFPGKTETCGLLGQIIAEIGGVFVDAGKHGAKLVVSTADEVENLVFGDDSHMPYDRYYGLYWLPWLHKSVDLCISHGCQGIGQLNERIWDACVDYFDSHNQYRSTAKKTCDDMRDKRYHKTYTLLAEAITTGAKSYARKLRAGAQAWAITEYGRNNQSAIRAHFLTLCETELEQGYPLTTGNPGMCNAYKQNQNPLIAGLYESCMQQVAQQQVTPTAWHNACRKAEPDFIALLQDEQQALQTGLEDLVTRGCRPRNGWTAAQGLRLRCETYPGFDECLKLMVVSAGSICSVDRNKADAARARKIYDYLGAKRCSLSGTEILCHRPWKYAQCKQLVQKTQGIQTSKSALTCKEESADYYRIAFANQALIEELNGPVARGGQGAACSWIEDKAKIKCLRTDNLKARIGAKPDLNRPACGSDPDYDGSDTSCYLLPYDLKASPKPQTAIVAPPSHAPPSATPAATMRNARTMTATPNTCQYEATYYVPQPPVIETSSPNYQAGDQVQIRCEFTKRTRKLEWAQCNDTARNAISMLKLSQESGSRYSGLFVIDGARVGVTSSPADGGDFGGSALWTFNEAGVHRVACHVDNGLRPAEEDSPVYLESRVELEVGGATGERRFRRFDPAAVQRLPANSVRQEPNR